MKYKLIKKEIGQTPLQALEVFRDTEKFLKDVPLTYAGRLDPMAEGKLLILIGEECKKREHYDVLDKEYEFEILLGFSTDTGDILGIAEKEFEEEETGFNSEKDFHALARAFKGTHTLRYPAFSSKTVGGKSLFEHALEGTLSGIEIPTTPMHIYRMKYVGREVIERGKLIENIVKKINLLKAPADSGRVGADFRKGEILSRWETLQNPAQKQHTVITFRAIVSSGTYVRALAPLIAEALGAKGLAYSIKRTKIGRYQPITPYFGFWKQVF